MSKIPKVKMRRLCEALMLIDNRTFNSLRPMLQGTKNLPIAIKALAEIDHSLIAGKLYGTCGKSTLDRLMTQYGAIPEEIFFPPDSAC